MSFGGKLDSEFSTRLIFEAEDPQRPGCATSLHRAGVGSKLRLLERTAIGCVSR
jgi:hypothetical protein